LVVFVEVLQQIAKVADVGRCSGEPLQCVSHSSLHPGQLWVLAEHHPYCVGQIINGQHIDVDVREVTITRTHQTVML